MVAQGSGAAPHRGCRLRSCRQRRPDLPPHCGARIMTIATTRTRSTTAQVPTVARGQRRPPQHPPPQPCFLQAREARQRRRRGRRTRKTARAMARRSFSCGLLGAEPPRATRSSRPRGSRRPAGSRRPWWSRRPRTRRGRVMRPSAPFRRVRLPSLPRPPPPQPPHPRLPQRPRPPPQPPPHVSSRT